uniref:Uncharacterized protein n=1 Tax=Arundo donax TaxID=35708 RepID=A0A0A8YR18_ARUDO
MSRRPSVLHTSTPVDLLSSSTNLQSTNPCISRSKLHQ